MSLPFLGEITPKRVSTKTVLHSQNLRFSSFVPNQDPNSTKTGELAKFTKFSLKRDNIVVQTKVSVDIPMVKAVLIQSDTINYLIHSTTQAANIKT